MSRQLSFALAAAGLRRDDRRDGSFRRPFRADATGAGADRTHAARRAGGGRARSRHPDATAADAPEEPIGNVATVTGSASVIRNDKTTPLKVKDDIYLNDVVQTGANSALGITFIDATTFNLKASTKITIDNYVYEDGGKSNAAIFDVAKGTAAFVAASVAKTGDMKITTPTATLGIRGTTGLVEVPEGAAANNPNNVAVKLYPDADGRVGRIEVNDRAGARLGFLTQGASGFTIRPGAGGARFAAVPLAIPQAVMLRDQGFVRQLHSTQNVGRQLVFQQREFRRANPGFVNPNRPIRQLQPGQQRPNGLPGQRRPEWSARDNPVSRRCRACRIVPDNSSPAAQSPRTATARSVEPARSAATTGRAEPPGTAAAGFATATGHAAARGTAAAAPARPISPACRRVRDNRHDPICRRSPACRRAQDNRNSPPCRRSPARRGTAGTAEQVRRSRIAAARPAFRVRLPCNVRDCPPHRGGLRPRRNAASRRRRNCGSRTMRGQVSRRSQSRSFCKKLRGRCRVRLSTVSTATGSISSANDGGPAGCASSTACSTDVPAVASITTVTSSCCATCGEG